MISEEVFWCFFVIGTVLFVILSVDIHKDDEDEYWN